jgi:hypothetical protein
MRSCLRQLYTVCAVIPSCSAISATGFAGLDQIKNLATELDRVPPRHDDLLIIARDSTTPPERRRGRPPPLCVLVSLPIGGLDNQSAQTASVGRFTTSGLRSPDDLVVRRTTSASGAPSG